MTNQKKLIILLVDADNVRRSTLNAKMKSLGYQVSHCHSIAESLEFQKKQPAQLLIVEQSLLDNFVGNYKRKMRDISKDHVSIFMLSTNDLTDFKSYFAKGVDGIFEQYLDAHSMLTAVRRSLLPQDLQWQMTQNLEPVEKLSFISQSLNELQQHKKLSFGSGGFCTQFSQKLTLGDRVEYSFYFTENAQSYVIQGISVIRWFDDQTLWGGMEFETMTGQGIPVFIRWLNEQDFSEFIPTAS